MTDFLKIAGFLLHFVLTVELLALRILRYDPIFPLIPYHMERIAKAMVYMLLADAALFGILYVLAPISAVPGALIGLAFVAEGFLALQLWYRLEYTMNDRAQWEAQRNARRRRTQSKKTKK